MSVDTPLTRTVVAWQWWTLAITVAVADQLTKLAVSTLMFYAQNIPLTGFSTWCMSGTPARRSVFSPMRAADNVTSLS